MSSVLVVVIVVVVIAAIVVATVGDGPKPATPRRDPKRRRAPRHAERSSSDREPVRNAPIAPVAPPPALPPDLPPEVPAEVPTDGEIGEIVELRRSFGQRLRALMLLAVTVVTLGSIAAVVLGGIVLAGARIIDRALG